MVSSSTSSSTTLKLPSTSLVQGGSSVIVVHIQLVEVLLVFWDGGGAMTILALKP